MFSDTFELDAIIANFVYYMQNSTNEIPCNLDCITSENTIAIPLLGYSYVLLRQFLALKNSVSRK